MVAKRQIPAITSEVRRISPQLVSILEPMRQRVQELTSGGSSGALTRADLLRISGFRQNQSGVIEYVPKIVIPDVLPVIESRFRQLEDSSRNIAGIADALFSSGELNTSLSALFAESYVLKLDVNGHVAGIGLAIEEGGFGSYYSRFIVQADQFAISIPAPYWSDNQAYLINQFVTPSVNPTGFVYEATTVNGAGVTGSVEPVWPTVVDTTVVDGDITWTARDVSDSIPFQVGSIGGQRGVGINGNLIVDGTITAGEVAAGSITTDKLAANAVTADKIAANAITSSKILAGNVTSASIAALAVIPGLIAANAVTGTEIASDAVGSSQIAANAVGTTEIAAAAITAAQLAANAVTAAAIAADSVGSSEVIAGSIGSVEIAASAVGSTEIANFSIITDKIAANAILAGQIAAGVITADKLVSNTITALQIAANTITAQQIAANTITAAQITAGTIVAALIASNTITANEIAANAITASEIAANAVTADKINVTELSAITADLGTVTAGLFRTGTDPAQRLEIDADGTYPIWYGSGAKNNANADFYLDSAGNGFFGGSLAVNGVVGDNITAGAVSINTNANGSITGLNRFIGDEHVSAGSYIQAIGGVSMGMIGGVGNNISGNSWTFTVRRRINGGAWTVIQTITVSPANAVDEESGTRVAALGGDSRWAFTARYIDSTSREFYLEFTVGDTPGAGDIEYDVGPTVYPTTSSPAINWTTYARIRTLEIKK